MWLTLPEPSPPSHEVRQEKTVARSMKESCLQAGSATFLTPTQGDAAYSLLGLLISTSN